MVDSIAIADCETGKTFVFLIPWGYLLPGLFLKAFEPLMKVGDGLGILLHIPVVDSIPLLDGFDEGRGELAEPDRIADVKSLYEVSCRGRRDGVDVRGVEVRDRHEDCSGSTRGAIWGHGDVGVGGAEWKGVG